MLQKISEEIEDKNNRSENEKNEKDKQINYPKRSASNDFFTEHTEHKPKRQREK
jgi:hypothetical protein